MLYPTKKLLWIITAWMLLALSGSFYPPLIVVWQVVSAVLFFIFAYEAVNLVQIPEFTSQRHTANNLSLGVWTAVKIRVSHAYNQALRLSVYDHSPDYAEIRDLPQSLILPSHNWAELTYHIKPMMRGEALFKKMQWLVESPLGLWQKTHWHLIETRVKVYPNFAPMMKYTLLAADNHLSQMGIRQRQRRGEGLEFHQLREYREGDSLRQIDWKATARLKKLISREYQDERDQQIFFLLDCGRRMASQDGHLSHFDHALNAMLLLAYVALKQGDAVGLMTFAGNKRCLPPKKGQSNINTILNTVYDLQAGHHNSDYLSVASEVVTHLKKRALIIILTNLRDEDSRTLTAALHLLKKHHLVLLASLRETILDATLKKPVTDFKQALQYTSTQHYLHLRQQSQEALQLKGCQVLDVIPEKLPTAIVNRYLDIKRGGLL